MGIVRSTFVIDKQGIIRQAIYDVKPKGHAAQVIDLVRQVD
jgi:peroxiredoxin